MATRLQEIKQLQKEMKECQKKIDTIQKGCPHLRIRHRLYLNHYGCQGQASACADCGKIFSCGIATVSSIENKTWVEHRKKETT